MSMELFIFVTHRDKMLLYYYLDSRPNEYGVLEVHDQRCKHLPNFSHRILLGMFSSSQEAILMAKKHFVSVNGCPYCCIENYRKMVKYEA